VSLEDRWATANTAFKRAEAPLPSEDEEQRLKKIKKEVARLLSQSAMAKIRSKFGPLGLSFFQFYRDLAEARHLRDVEAKFPGGAWPELRRRARMLARTKISPAAQNQVSAVVDEIRPWLRAIERDPYNRMAWLKVIRNIGPLLALVAKDKGLYLKAQERGPERWVVFRVMRPKEKQLETIKDNDPALYDAIQRHRGKLREVEDHIQLSLEEEGLNPKRKFIMGRAAFVGTDPATGEEVVYDWANEAMPMREYLEERKRENRAVARQSRVFPETRALNQMRRVDEEAITELEGDIEFVSLTDDKAKSSGLTRIFPVKMDANGRQVIVKGRFKGFYLDEMVNAAGRMIEGTAYNYNPRTNRFEHIESHGPKGQLTVRAEREPYVTVAERKVKVRGKKRPVKVKKLFVKIPGGRAFTEMRQAISKLAKLVPSIEYLEGTRRSEFYFDPKDFNIVRDALQSMSMSEGAAKLIRDYFKQLAQAEQATADENLGYYTMEAIGGFKQTVRGPDKGLLTKQKQALAWMEARGNSGVCALGTGVGKTATAIAMMQKLQRDGLEEEGNGRYLYVCPKALRGNIKKEIWKFLTDDARKDLMSRLDIMTYPQFRNAWKKNPKFADDYVAIFFDEAQQLRSGTTQTSKAALQIRHPRKILLTAAPTEKEPMDAYVLSAIANNVDVSPRTEGRRDMLKFQRRFTETIGGRTVGVKQDPLTKNDLQTFMKQNVFYGDKQDVEEFELPKLTQQTVALEMPPEIEGAYRETISEVKDVLRGMVARFKFRGVDPETGRRIPEARDRRIGLMFSAKLAPLIKKLNDLANFPERYVSEVAERDPDGSPVRDWSGNPVMVRTSNPKMDESLRIVSEEWMNSAGRTVLYTDDAQFVMSAAQMLSARMPGPYHLAAISKGIYVFQNGQQLSFYMGFDMPFREKKYKRHMDEPANDTCNKNYERAFWQSFVFNEIVAPNNNIVSATLHGQVYQTGQNLQAFSNVVHLDRDTWNSEDMKQRTARAWRQGQQNPVQEYTLDMTYGRSTDALDRTLDEIRGILQEMDSDLFKQIIKDSQNVVLGEEYYSMRRTQARLFDIDHKSLALVLSPYVEQSTTPMR